MNKLEPNFFSKRETKEFNRVHSINVLIYLGFDVIQFSDYHFRIMNVDFWPTTLKFWDKETEVAGYGLDQLIKHLKIKKKQWGEEKFYQKQWGVKVKVSPK